MKTSIDQTEALLREGLVQPPADFRDRVGAAQVMRFVFSMWFATSAG